MRANFYLCKGILKFFLTGKRSRRYSGIKTAPSISGSPYAEDAPDIHSGYPARESSAYSGIGAPVAEDGTGGKQL